MLTDEQPAALSFKERLIQGAIFRILWFVSTTLAASVRYKVLGWENVKLTVEGGKGGLLLPWHGKTILPIYYCRNMGFYSIVSLSKDGELQNRLLLSRGFKTLRGSNAKRGARALLESVRVLRNGGVVALTPDGPKGPIFKVQAGVVHMAKHSGCPVVPIGVACKPCKRLEKAWDRHLIPGLFSKAVLVFGDPLYVNSEEDDEIAASRIEDAINSAEKKAQEVLG